MKILLTDTNKELVEEWETARDQYGMKVVSGSGHTVECFNRDIFSEPVDAVVSPANSFGFMDGGIDAVYLRRWGLQLQERIQWAIEREFFGELLVGQSMIINTTADSAPPSADFPQLIVAPTMRVPMRIIDPIAVRLSTRAAVRAARIMGLGVIAMPGMGALTGAVPPAICARLMMLGIADVLQHRSRRFYSWRDARDDGNKGISGP